MSGTAFALLPKGTQVRQAAIAVLKGFGTIAAVNVQDSPLDPVQTDAEPQINVFSSERRDGRATAGSRPGFHVQFTLQVQILVTAAVQTDAVRQMEVLKQQVLEALFGDPVFPSLFEPGVTIEEKPNFGRDGQRYVAEGLIGIQSGWIENYDQRSTSVLLPTGQPAMQRQVIAGLAAINDTIVAGSAPGAGGQGTAQTAFASNTTLTPAAPPVP